MTTTPTPPRGISPPRHVQSETEHHAHHRFADAERWAEKFDAPSRDRWQRPEAVIDFIDPDADAIIADLGAGTGYFTLRFAQRVPRGRIFATDIESDMVRYVSERAMNAGLDHVTAVQAADDDPGLPEAVDVAFMCNVVHHLSHRVEFFRKVVARLRPGGRVVIVDFKKDARADIPGPPPAIRVAHEALIAELAAAGLAPARVDRTMLPHQYVIEFVAASP